MQNDSMSIMYVYLYMAFPLNMAATLKLTALALLRIITILYCRRPPPNPLMYIPPDCEL